MRLHEISLSLATVHEVLQKHVVKPVYYSPPDHILFRRPHGQCYGLRNESHRPLIRSLARGNSSTITHPLPEMPNRRARPVRQKKDNRLNLAREEI